MTVKAFITNLGAYNAGRLVGEWIDINATEEEHRAALERIGNPEEVFYTDYESEDAPELVDCLGEFESWEQLQGLGAVLEEMDGYEVDTLAAVLESGIASARGAAELAAVCEDVGHGGYNLMYGVDDVEELGEYYADVCGVLEEIPERLRYYFDFEAFGRDYAIEAQGDFCSAGWIERTA